MALLASCLFGMLVWYLCGSIVTPLPRPLQLTLGDLTVTEDDMVTWSGCLVCNLGLAIGIPRIPSTGIQSKYKKFKGNSEGTVLSNRLSRSNRELAFNLVCHLFVSLHQYWVSHLPTLLGTKTLSPQTSLGNTLATLRGTKPLTHHLPTLLGTKTLTHHLPSFLGKKNL
jgi:hypothetical protein